jgi:hypothetical protein
MTLREEGVQTREDSNLVGRAPCFSVLSLEHIESDFMNFRKEKTAMEILAIGQPYDPSIANWPEGCHYNYDASGHWLHYMYSNPTPLEISSIESGEAQFGLYIYEPVIFLLHRFGEMAWHDAAYSWWLVSEEFRHVPTVGDGLHALLKVVLIDSETGLIKALRALTFSPEFTEYLHQAVRRQLEKPWNAAKYERAMRHVYGNYSTMDLVDRVEAFCKGGD